MANANSKDLYIPLSTIYGKQNADGTYTLTALDIKNLNDNLYAIAKKIQGGLNLSDLTDSTKQTFDGMVTFTDLATGGSTVINGDNIQTGSISADLITTGTLQNLTFVHDVGAMRITINGGVLSFSSIDGDAGRIFYDPFSGRFVIEGPDYDATKISGGSNVSIDSDNGTVYIGSSSGSGNHVYIGRQNVGRVDLWGDVYINGVLQE